MTDLFGDDEYAGLSRSACISPCGLYRYWLRRAWTRGGNGKTATFIMLNPSTADGSVDDPTIRRCMNYVQAWGYSALMVNNLFAFRATEPTELTKAADPVGPDNDAEIERSAMQSDLIVCAWGAANWPQRIERVLDLLRGAPAHCLRLTKHGQPWHPLYCPADLQPIQFPPSFLGG